MKRLACRIQSDNQWKFIFIVGNFSQVSWHFSNGLSSKWVAGKMEKFNVVPVIKELTQKLGKSFCNLRKKYSKKKDSKLFKSMPTVPHKFQLRNHTLEVTNLNWVVTPVDRDKIEVLVCCAQGSDALISGTWKETVEVNNSSLCWIKLLFVKEIRELTERESHDFDVVGAKNLKLFFIQIQFFLEPECHYDIFLDEFLAIWSIRSKWPPNGWCQTDI